MVLQDKPYIEILHASTFYYVYISNYRKSDSANEIHHLHNNLNRVHVMDVTIKQTASCQFAIAWNANLHIKGAAARTIE